MASGWANDECWNGYFTHLVESGKARRANNDEIRIDDLRYMFYLKYVGGTVILEDCWLANRGSDHSRQ